MPMALTKVTDNPEEVRLYHITHIDNLSSIVNAGSIRSLNTLKGEGINHRSIAYSHMQERRDSITIALPPGGNLHDYVPWSFAARAPMLFTAWRGRLNQGVQQHDIIHLVTDVQKALQLQLKIIYTDGHPVTNQLTQFFTDLEQLPQILDWDLLIARQWSNTEEDSDRKRRRQAELLMYGDVPWSIVRGIAVQNHTISDQVASIIKHSSHQPKIVILPEWYYA